MQGKHPVKTDDDIVQLAYERFIFAVIQEEDMHGLQSTYSCAAA